MFAVVESSLKICFRFGSAIALVEYSMVKLASSVLNPRYTMVNYAVKLTFSVSNPQPLANERGVLTIELEAHVPPFFNVKYIPKHVTENKICIKSITKLMIRCSQCSYYSCIYVNTIVHLAGEH